MIGKILRGIARFFLWTLISTIFILLVVTLVFSLPATQTKAGKYASDWLNERYEVNIQLQSARYQFPNLVRLRNVRAFDEYNDTLAHLPEIIVRIGRPKKNVVRLNSVFLNQPMVKMLLPETDTVNNWQVFLAKFVPEESDTLSDLRLEIGDFSCKEGTFRKYRMAEDTLQFHLKQGDIEIRNFFYHQATVGARIESLNLRGRRAELEDLQGMFFYQKNKGVALNRAKIKTNESLWEGDLYFDVESNDDYLDFVNVVQLKFNIDRLELESNEIRRYIPSFPDLGKLLAEGFIEGTINDLAGENVRLHFGSATVANADLRLRNVLHPATFNLDLNLPYFSSNYTEFSYLLRTLVNEDISFAKAYVDRFSFSGKFRGSMDQFRADGKMITKDGVFEMAVDVKGNNKPLKFAQYSGLFTGKDVNVGHFAKNNELGLANFELEIKGKGLIASEFFADVKGKVHSIRYDYYTFKSISLDGKFRQSEFMGVFKVNDPNLKLSFDGSARIGQREIDLDFQANIEEANLPALGIVKNDSVYNISGEAFVLLNRDKFGDWVGEVQIVDVLAMRSERVYFFRDIKLNSFTRGGNNHLLIDSDILRFNANGNFTLGELAAVWPNYLANFSSYHEADTIYEHVNLTFSATTGDTRLLTDLLAPDWYIFPESSISGTFNKKGLELQVESDVIKWKNQELRKLILKLGGDETKEIVAQIAMDELRLGNMSFTNPGFDFRLEKDSLIFDSRALFSQQIGGKLNLTGSMKQNRPGVYQINLEPAEWLVGNGAFRIMPGSEVFIEDGSIRIFDFEIDSEGRRLLVNGGVSASPFEILRVELENFYIDIFNFLWEGSGYELLGELEGEIILGSILDAPRFASNLRIDSLVINENHLGNLFIDSEWYIYDQFVELDLHLDRGTLRTLEIAGKFFPEKKEQPLDLNLTARRFNLAPLTPLFSVFTDNVRGVASGNLQVKGSFGQPELSGKLQLPNFGMSVPYLNTDYNLEGSPEIVFTPDSILIPGARIRDNDEQTAGFLTARMSHRFFRDWALDIHIDADRLLMLNTNLLLNEYYYGKAFVSGDIDIKGPTSDLKMLINVKTNRGTQFFIPVDGPTEVNPMGFVDFVRFVDIEKEDTNKRLVGDASGLSLQFNVDVTPDAEVVMIMDQRTGEAIRGNGRGNLRLNLDPQGNISLFGNLEINRGEYLFTLGGLVRKRFLIEPGGSITFNGDPYEALLDLTSRYVTRTSLNGAVADPTIAAVRTEVNLLLKLYGPLLNPEIGFEIKLPNVAPGIQAEVADRFADPNRLTQQAFSLLALNSFYADDLGLDAQVGGGLANTTIDVFANQVNNFLSRYVKVVDIAINYTGEGVTGASQEEFEVAVSQRLFEDRVSINGVVGVPLGANQNQLAGDVEVEVMLTEDGRVRAKAFNRSYQNNLLIEQTGLYSQGVGLFYRTDFNRRRELLRRIFLLRGSEYRD
jgi:hypothetical protein